MQLSLCGQIFNQGQESSENFTNHLFSFLMFERYFGFDKRSNIEVLFVNTDSEHRP